MTKAHGERKHAKLSASGAERWVYCPGSIALSEGMQPKDNVYSLEGTLAHEVVEAFILKRGFPEGTTKEMVMHAKNASDHILRLHDEAKHAELLVEEKVYLDFIHPEAFGTLDYAVVEHFGTLQILDFKYGKSPVSPKENLQFLFYALAVGYKYDWNFNKVRMWTLQPRVAGFEGYTFWEITTRELMGYISVFRDAARRVEQKTADYAEGKWCYFCVAKAKCPLKQQRNDEKAMTLFKPWR